MQFTVSLDFHNRYWNQVHAKHENKHVQYIGIKTETRQEINAVNRNLYIRIRIEVFIYPYTVLHTEYICILYLRYLQHLHVQFKV